MCPGVSLPEHWHWLAQGRGGFVLGEGGQQEGQDPGGAGCCGLRVLVLGEEYKASGGHIRAREGDTGRLCLEVGVI